MDEGVFLKGLILGFSLAAPVGPIGLLCIRRTLTDGWKMGLATGIGAALADTIYGMMAAFGLTAVTTALMSAQDWLRIAGGFFLLYLGVQILRSRPPEASSEPPTDAGSLFRACGSTFLLTVANPLTVVTFLALFAGMGLGAGKSDFQTSLLVVLGVFIGSALWWVILSGGVRVLRDRIRPAMMVWVNRASGAAILLLAIFALFAGFK